MRKTRPFLEQPREGFAYFRHQGVPRVNCQEKHMGSRAVIVLCRDGDIARRRFGVTGGETGVVYTRTGRPFFADPQHEAEVEAVFALDTDVAELLIRKGADLSLTDPVGLTPLQCAQQHLTVLRLPEMITKVQAMIDLLTKHTPGKS